MKYTAIKNQEPSLQHLYLKTQWREQEKLSSNLHVKSFLLLLLFWGGLSCFVPFPIIYRLASTERCLVFDRDQQFVFCILFSCFCKVLLLIGAFLKPKRTMGAPFWRDMSEWKLPFSLEKTAITQASLFKKRHSWYVMAFIVGSEEKSLIQYITRSFMLYTYYFFFVYFLEMPLSIVCTMYSNK